MGNVKKLMLRYSYKYVHHITNRNVTVREHDSMKQERMPIADVKKYIEDRIAF